MVRESQLPHMESLVPDVAVVGCRGEERREAHWERQVGPMCVTRGPLSNAVGPALPVSGRGSWVMGEWGFLPGCSQTKPAPPVCGMC